MDSKAQQAGLAAVVL